jgi:hypothetical protein
VDHPGRASDVFAPGDCQLSGPSVDTVDCDGVHWSLDFYTKLHGGNAIFC